MPGTRKRAARKAGGCTKALQPTKSGEEMRSLARAAASTAIARLIELSNSDDERVALAATQELLNRAFGKTAAAAGDDQNAAAQQLVVKIVRFGSSDPEPEPTTLASTKAGGRA